MRSEPSKIPKILISWQKLTVFHELDSCFSLVCELVVCISAGRCVIHKIRGALIMVLVVENRQFLPANEDFWEITDCLVCSGRVSAIRLPEKPQIAFWGETRAALFWVTAHKPARLTETASKGWEVAQCAC